MHELTQAIANLLVLHSRVPRCPLSGANPTLSTRFDELAEEELMANYAAELRLKKCANSGR